jgi:hypothetical protein
LGQHDTPSNSFDVEGHRRFGEDRGGLHVSSAVWRVEAPRALADVANLSVLRIRAGAAIQAGGVRARVCPANAKARFSTRGAHRVVVPTLAGAPIAARGSEICRRALSVGAAIGGTDAHKFLSQQQMKPRQRPTKESHSPI